MWSQVQLLNNFIAWELPQTTCKWKGTAVVQYNLKQVVGWVCAEICCLLTPAHEHSFLLVTLEQPWVPQHVLSLGIW